MKQFVVALAASVSLVLLAGCASFGPSAGVTPSAGRTTDSASPTPTPTPRQPALAELVVTPEGFGPVRIGSPVAAQPAGIAVAAWDPTACAPEAGAAYAGAWRARYPTVDWRGQIESAPFTFASERMTSPVAHVVIWSAELRTAEGIGIGSTLAELTAAYPSPSRVAGPTSDLYLVPGSTGQLVFDVPRDADVDFSMWSAEDLGRVAWVYLQPRGATASSIANSDVGGSCSA